MENSSQRFLNKMKFLFSKISTMSTPTKRSSSQATSEPEKSSNPFPEDPWESAIYQPRYPITNRTTPVIPKKIVNPYGSYYFTMDSLDIDSYLKAGLKAQLEHPMENEIGHGIAPKVTTYVRNTAQKHQYINPDLPYKEGAIVYQIPNEHRPSPQNPFVYSPYEIDIKIIKVLGDTNYKAITGNGYITIFSHNGLVSMKNKHIFAPEGYFTVEEDTELFPKGTVFVKSNDYFHSHELGISIHETRFISVKSKLSKLQQL